jgi:hypothetical protein
MQVKDLPPRVIRLTAPEMEEYFPLRNAAPPAIDRSPVEIGADQEGQQQ